VCEGERTSSMASEVCMDKGMFKGWTVWISNFEMQAKKKERSIMEFAC